MERCTPDDVGHVLGKLFKFEWAKYGLAAGIATLVNFIRGAPDPWRSLLIAAVVLLAVDFASGIIASVAVRRVRISSVLAGRTLLKVFCYSAVLVVASVIDDLLHAPYTTTLLVLSIVVAREGLSALENIRSVWMKLGYKWPFDFLADRLHRVGGDGQPAGGSPPAPAAYRNGNGEG